MANRTYCMLIDIKRDIFEIIKLKPIDTGNKIRIKFSEDGKPVDLTGQTVKFVAKKPDGTGVYNFAEIIDARAGEIEVKITNQMTAVDGELDCEIEIEGKELITTMTFYITVDRKLNDGYFIESTNEFTVLQKAIRDSYEAIELMETKTNTKLEQVQSQVNTAIKGMNSKADTKLSQLQSQANTAISNMNNTTNTKLVQLQSQVNTAIEGMNETTDTKLMDLQQQVTTAIASMNSKADTKLTQVQSQVNNKLTAIQGQVDTLGSTLTKKVNDKVTEVTATQDTLTSKVNAKITELTNAVNTKITEHTNTIKSKVAEVDNKLQTVNNKISEVNSTVSNANSTVTVLKRDVATAIAGIDTKMDSKLATKSDIGHNHDTSYLKLTGGTITGETAFSNYLSINAWSGYGTGKAQLWFNGSTKTLTLQPTTSDIMIGSNLVYHAGRKPTPAEIGASASNHTHTSIHATNLSGQTVSLDTYNLASGSPQVAHYYCPTDGGGSGITGRPNDNTKSAFSLKVEVIRWANSTDYITKQTYIRGAEKVIYIRYCTNGTWSAWENVYTSNNKPTPADIGASASNHTHDSVYLGKTAKATSATIADTAKAVEWANVTGKPTSFAPTSHNHDSSYLKLSGGKISMADYYGLVIQRNHASNGSSIAFSNTTEQLGGVGFQTGKFVVNSGTNTHGDLMLITATDVTLGSKNVTASKFTGALSGNASTATTLQTARTINGTSFNGSANITTANWGTARNITIGSTTKSVNGSANVSWSLSEIGASASNHTHSYLSLSGGTMTGKITNSFATTTYIAGNQGNALINSSTTAGAYVMLYRYPSNNGYFTMGGYQDKYLLQYTNKSTVDAGTNTVNKSVTLLDESGNTRFAGTVSAPTFTGALSGNASTATTLQTARTINGTPFNGSGNITTANWGTARTITIGNTSKSVNGADNVSWSLAEIGADTGATAHKLAQRDSSGDINVRLVRSNFTNQSTISGAMAFRVNNSSDNYIRFCSDTTAIRNWLGASASNHGHDNYVGGSSANASTKITNFNNVWKSGFYDGEGASNMPFDGWNWLINSAHSQNRDGYKYGLQIVGQNVSNNFAMRNTNVHGEGTWCTLYHNHNKPSYGDLGFGSIPTHAPLITNLNSHLQSGWYSINPSTSGRPSGVDFGVVLQIRWYNGADFYQICLGSNNARIYTRGYINGGYTSWNEK